MRSHGSPASLRAITVANVLRYERPLAAGTDAFARKVASAVSIEGRGAVGADDPEVLEPVVVRNAIDMVENERHWLALPQFSLAAHVANGLPESLLKEPS